MGYRTGVSSAIPSDLLTTEELQAILGTALGPFADLGQRVDSLAQQIAALPGQIRFSDLADVSFPAGAPTRGQGEMVPDGAGGWTFVPYTILNDPVAFATFITGVPASLAISTTALPSGIKNTAYAGVTLAATGGTAPYTWSIVSGWGTGGDSTHPIAGLTLNTSTGAITGTPTQFGALTLVIRATDSAGSPAHVDKTLTMTIADVAAPLVFAPATPAHAKVGLAYVDDSLLAGASGGTGPYTFTATGLANRILLDTDGSATTHRGRLYTAVGAAPDAQATLTLVVTCTDAALATAQATVTLVIDPASAVPVSITTTSLPGGTKNAAYSGATLAATGGTTPYTWSIVSGWGTGGDATHPIAGLTLNASTGAITGTPTQFGDFTPIFKATDSLGATATVSLPMHIADVGAALALTLPVALARAKVASAYDVDIAALYVTGGTAPYTVNSNSIFGFPTLPNHGLGMSGTHVINTRALVLSDVSFDVAVAFTVTDNVGAIVHGTTFITVDPAFSGAEIDISDLVGTTTYPGGGAVVPSNNVSLINSRLGTCKTNGSRLKCSGASVANPVVIMVGAAAGATTSGVLLTADGVTDFSQLKNVTFRVAPNQPVNVSGKGAGGTIFYIQNAGAAGNPIIMPCTLDGQAALQTKNVPLRNDHGYYCTGFSYFNCGPILHGEKTINIRGVTGSSHNDTTAGATTVAAGSNGVNVNTFAGAGVLNVVSTAGTGSDVAFTPSQSTVKIGTINIAYTGKTGTTFTGCTLISGSGTLATGQAVVGTPHDGAQEVFPVQVRFSAGGDTGVTVMTQNDGTGHENAFALAATSISTTGTHTKVNHGLIVGQGFTFGTVGALTGVTAGPTYYVTTVPTDDTFTFSATRNGSTLVPGGTTSSVTINTKAGSQEAASGLKWHYMGLNVDGRLSPVSRVVVKAYGQRHGGGGYCGGNFIFAAGSEARGCDHGFNIEAGISDPSGTSNPNARPTGDVTVGDAAGATNGQIKTVRCNIGITVNGNNTASGTMKDVGIQVNSVHVYGHDSIFDDEANNLSNQAPGRYEEHNSRIILPLTEAVHFAASGTVLAAQQAAYFITSSTLTTGSTVMNAKAAYDAQTPPHGTYTLV